jgi:hypothetical protein
VTKHNHRVPWNETSLEQLRQLACEGADIGEIAKIMGRTQEAVRYKASQQGIALKFARILRADHD